MVGEHQAYFSPSHYRKYLFSFSCNLREFQGIKAVVKDNTHSSAGYFCLSAGTGLLILPLPSLPSFPHLEAKPSCVSAIFLRARASKESLLVSLSTDFKMLQAHLRADPTSRAAYVKKLHLNILFVLEN